MTSTPAARIAEALAEHLDYRMDSKRGLAVCCGCGAAGVHRSLSSMAEHLAEVIAALPDIAIIELPPAKPLTVGVNGKTASPLVAMDVARMIYADALAAHRAAGGES